MPLENSYARLPASFYSRVAPTPVASPALIRLNRSLADHLGLDPDLLASPAGLEILSGNRVPASARPLAQAYAGHQFGNWVPQLGDGRAVLLGEVVDRDGMRRDIQLKGAGPTPYSRIGDGRASIGPVVREYLASEHMAALGIATTRALAAIATGEHVFRERPEPGGILARVASSHVRVGTFQYIASREGRDGVQILADYVIDRHYPGLADSANPYLALLEAVSERTADLVASWLMVGFIHGVMNTDNLSVAGETLDYGPFGFVDFYDPGTVYSSIDAQGRYAYNRQPDIAQWNLARLAETLLPLIDENGDAAVEKAYSVLSGYARRFETRYHEGLRRKIGLSVARDGDAELALELLEIMGSSNADMTLTFRRLSYLDGTDPRGDDPVRELFAQPGAFDAWARKWRQRLAVENRGEAERRSAMCAVNPAYILRNHLAQRAVDAAVESLDFSPMERLLEVLSHPYDDQPGNGDYSLPPKPEERVLRTFCGT
jgi:uncharacterized protein YdiU (UPF0061 family)